MPLNLLPLHLLNSSSLPVTLITMNTHSSISRPHNPLFTRVIPHRPNSQSLSSFHNLGFHNFTTTLQPELQLFVKHMSQIKAANSLIEDEFEVNSGSFRKRELYSERDDSSNDRRGSYRGGRGGSRGGRGGSGMNRRNDDFNGGYENRERRGGGSRGSFGGSSRGRGRFGGGRGSGSSAGRGRGRFGGELERRNDRFSRDSDKGKESWGSFFSYPEGKEPYVRDSFVSNRRDDRFGDGGGRGRGRGRGRGGGNGGVTTGVKRSMERGSLMVVDDENVDDEEEESKLMYNYRDLISEDDDDDDDEEEEEDVEGDGVLEKGPSLSPPRVPMEGSESYLSETRFDECSVSPLSLKGIKDAGYEKMTIVQEATLPVILKGKDVLAKARTGTGKTVAFLLPSIEVVVNSPPVSRDQKWPPIQVLVICPTRELANQAAMEANKLLKYHPSVGVQVVIGGTRITTEQRRLQTNPCQILVATPGRLKDHIMNTSGFATRVKGVKVLVLDEADHLLDMGFRKDIEIIIAAVSKQRQTLLFSATVPPEVRQICHIALKRDHEYINTVEEGSEETHTQVQQKHMIAPLDTQFPLVYTLLKDHIASDADYKVLVFCTTAMVTKLVADLLGQMRLNVREIHSRKSQSYRTQVSDEFRKSKGLILVTSDVSARGVDYPDVTLVIQIGLPSDKAQYIHRLGRTGRKGKEGEGILLLAPWEEFFLSTLRDLPISKADPPLIDPDTKKKVAKVLSYVDMKIKEMAYQAWLGYYNSNKTVGRDKSKLVELANEFSRSMGLDTPPAMSKLVLGKMGLKNVPGLRFK
ncbi:putative RNA helicase [Helianthus annuus]|nr:putative RNA helicase [Helianthus annuus]